MEKENNFSKEYAEISVEFRKSNGSKESIERLYDLLYKMERSERSKNDDLTLSNIYTLLGFHQSACELFKSAADLTDRKNISKLYLLEEKAKSHKNDFIIKDIRKFRGENKQIKLLPTDFVSSESGRNEFKVIDKDVLIFNKVVKNSKVEVCLYGVHKFENYADKIVDYIYWLGDCRNKLIEFYNSEVSEWAGTTANDDWYDTLEIFGVRVIVGVNGNLYSEISCGDDNSQDHILDIEIENETITSMNYDG